MEQQHLEAKRGALEKSLEQLVGQINRVNGAIAVVDELIAESKAREDADLEAEAAWEWDPADYTPLDPPEANPILYGGIDRTPSEHWKIREYPDLRNSAPSAPHVEMLPVMSGDAEDEQRSAPGAA